MSPNQFCVTISYLDSMHATVVGPIDVRQQVDGECGEQRSIAVRLARIAPIVADMDDAVERLVGRDGDVHQVALALCGHSWLELKPIAECSTRKR